MNRPANNNHKPSLLASRALHGALIFAVILIVVAAMANVRGTY